MALLLCYLSQYLLLPAEDTDGQEICGGKTENGCKGKETRRVISSRGSLTVESVFFFKGRYVRILKIPICQCYRMYKLYLISEKNATNKKYVRIHNRPNTYSTFLLQNVPVSSSYVLLFIAILVWLWVIRRGLVAKTTTSEAFYSQIYFKHYNPQCWLSELLNKSK